MESVHKYFLPHDSPSSGGVYITKAIQTLQVQYNFLRDKCSIYTNVMLLHIFCSFFIFSSINGNSSKRHLSTLALDSKFILLKLGLISNV